MNDTCRFFAISNAKWYQILLYENNSYNVYHVLRKGLRAIVSTAQSVVYEEVLSFNLSKAFTTLCGCHSKRLPCSHITVTVFAVVLDGSESMMFPSISG